VYSNNGTLLATTSPVSSPFFANQASHWRTETVALSGFNKTGILVKFVTTSDNGNNLFLDNINIREQQDVGLAKNTNVHSLSVFPNPAQNELNLKINGAKAGIAHIKVYNSVGQIVHIENVTVTAVPLTHKISTSHLSEGLYTVSVTSTEGALNQQIIIKK
jgi:hypothetical protein